ncbi:type IV pilus twitching motility protein PilT [Oleiharenicola sp. Vm1]|uniref:type IV pilus twitching motility protein PilT n=1 Tax=Oleiharenicola sp. Vm1 TaxID=3398393 RepID=UPI0039F5FC4B
MNEHADSANQLLALLTYGVGKDASDWHLVTGQEPRLRMDGKLSRYEQSWVVPQGLENVVLRLCGLDEVRAQKALEAVHSEGSWDGALNHEKRRFRVQITKAGAAYYTQMRLIPEKIRPLHSLGLPAKYEECLARERGLILVCGATGEGKSTTLASSIDWINDREELAIQTFEQPIEFVHASKKSLVVQGEIGQDVPSFGTGGRVLMRRDPDVILLGELRDLDSIGAALTLADTGHLVFATLHTGTASAAIERLLQAFGDSDNKTFYRTMLTQMLVCVLAQVLVDKKDGHGRVPAFELLLNNTAIANLIAEKRPTMIRSQIAQSRGEGMQTLDQHLAELVQRQVITESAALAKAVKADELRRLLKEPRK